MVNWDEVLLRSSCAGKVLAESKGTGLTEKQAELLVELSGKYRTPKQDITLAELIAKRDAPPTLGDTCISYLKEVYVYKKYGKEPMGGSQRSVYTIKGKSVEDESILMLGRLDGREYEKNTERKNDDYFTGESDIAPAAVDFIKDIKSSWDFATMLSVIGKPLNPLYYSQGQVYLHLWGRKYYEVCYCLVNMPQELIEGEKRKIFYAMNPVSDQSPEYLKEIEKLENAWTFDDVPIRERVVRFGFEYDPTIIDKLKKKWDACREWLKEFEKIHTSLNN